MALAMALAIALAVAQWHLPLSILCILGIRTLDKAQRPQSGFHNLPLMLCFLLINLLVIISVIVV
jgi:hypothetical protein